MIDLYSGSSNLGDNLSLTPLCHATACRVHLYDDEGCRGIGPLFDGVADVVYDNGSPTTRGPAASTPVGPLGPPSHRLLAYYGFPNACAIPRIKLTEAEIEEGQRFAAGFVAPLCAFKAAPQELNYRTPPLDLLQRMVASDSGTTYISFGLSKSHAKYNTAHVPVPGVRELFDLPIRRQAAYFHAMGYYLGPDTGDYHLMLAVGGRCLVLAPPTASHYDYRTTHYRGSDFAGELPRVYYQDWMQL